MSISMVSEDVAGSKRYFVVEFMEWRGYFLCAFTMLCWYYVFSVLDLFTHIPFIIHDTQTIKYKDLPVKFLSLKMWCQ